MGINLSSNDTFYCIFIARFERRILVSNFELKLVILLHNGKILLLIEFVVFAIFSDIADAKTQMQT